MAVKKLTEIPTVCPCLVREVSGEERLRFLTLAFSGAAGFCRCMNAQAAERGCTG